MRRRVASTRHRAHDWWQKKQRGVKGALPPISGWACGVINPSAIEMPRRTGVVAVAACVLALAALQSDAKSRHPYGVLEMDNLTLPLVLDGAYRPAHPASECTRPASPVSACPRSLGPIRGQFSLNAFGAAQGTGTCHAF
jgi:hypothetical protein